MRDPFGLCGTNMNDGEGADDIDPNTGLSFSDPVDNSINTARRLNFASMFNDDAWQRMQEARRQADPTLGPIPDDVGPPGQTMLEFQQAVGAAGGAMGMLRALPSGLRNATTGLQQLFGGGSVRGRAIVDIRATLRANGFTQSLTRNRSGYLFENAAGEQVRIMRRGGGWDIRIRNRNSNDLDEFGNVGDPGTTHGIGVGL